MKHITFPLFCAAAFTCAAAMAQIVQPIPAGGQEPESGVVQVQPQPQNVRPAAARPQNGAVRRDIVSYVEELAGNTAARLRVVQDENAALEARMVELERRVAVLQETNKQLLNEVAAVKRQAAADADARESQLKTILSKIDKLASMPAAAPVRSTPAPVSAPDGEYEIYEVQKGATLSVIAQAYGVSVPDIRKANNLKGDILQIGQKLKIPKK